MADTKKSVYIETTIPSYATGKASRDIIIAHRQSVTKIFWDNERQKYDLYVSDYVIDECGRGDPEAAARRLNFIKDITPIPENEAIARLADVYFGFLNIPEQSKYDLL